jgi:hypothetical protein
VIIRQPSVIVTARVAALIEGAVADVLAQARRNGVQLVPDVVETLADLHKLAAWWWRTSAASAQPRRAAEAESASEPMTVNEVAAICDVTPHRIRQRLRAGDLAGEKIDGRWRIPADARDGMTQDNE